MLTEPERSKPLTPLSPLPIVELNPLERKKLAEKYGALFYLSIAGLVILLLLIGRFAYGLWTTRDLWSAIYRLNDGAASEQARLNAAFLMAHHPASNDRMRREASFNPSLPPLARYILAESLSAEAMKDNPAGYALAISRNPDWPDWLRLLHLRALALGAGEGEPIAQEPLLALTSHDDPMIRLWAHYARAESSRENVADRQALEAAASTDWPGAEAARLLLDALNATDRATRETAVGKATRWLRSHYPPAKILWAPWTESDDGIHRVPGSLSDPDQTGPTPTAPDATPPPGSDEAGPSSAPTSPPGSE